MSKYLMTSATVDYDLIYLYAIAGARTEGVLKYIRGDEDQGLVSSEEGWTRPVI